MKLDKGSFVKLDFTGHDDDTNAVFDTTRKEVASNHGLIRGKVDYGPITICVGEGHLLPGLDKALEGKEDRSIFSVSLEPEDAFGKKRADLLKLMPMNVFKKQKINPVPGLEVNIDGMHGTIKNVSGNRVIVDFNHPLASHAVSYDIRTLGEVTDVAEQVKTIVSIALRYEPEVKVEGLKAKVPLPVALPEELKQQLTARILDLTALREVEFSKIRSNA